MKENRKPTTKELMARKNLSAFDRRYSGKRVGRDENKRAAILKRERRLNAIGWSLLYFNG